MKALEWSQHFSNKSMGIFQDTQGQVTPQFKVRSCRKSNPFEILYLFSVPERIKKIQVKIKVVEWSQEIPHYNPMGAICCHGNQCYDPIRPIT